MIVVTVARRPLETSTVAEQVLDTGTGAIHIDAIRIKGSSAEVIGPGSYSDPGNRRGEVSTDLGFTGNGRAAFQAAQAASVERANRLGRWPSNIVFHHPEGCSPMVDIERCPMRERGVEARFFKQVHHD